MKYYRVIRKGDERKLFKMMNLCGFFGIGIKHGYGVEMWEKLLETRKILKFYLLEKFVYFNVF